MDNITVSNGATMGPITKHYALDYVPLAKTIQKTLSGLHGAGNWHRFKAQEGPAWTTFEIEVKINEDESYQPAGQTIAYDDGDVDYQWCGSRPPSGLVALPSEGPEDSFLREEFDEVARLVHAALCEAVLRKLQPALSGVVGNARQLRLVIDTNIILKALRWLVSKRQNPAARTDLQELIGSETVIAFAPDVLGTEVLEHIPEMAIALGVREIELRESWHEYEKALHFYSPTLLVEAIPRSARDPDDLPFVLLSQLVGAAAVYTLDKDVPAMGAPAMSPQVVLVLRDYARAASIELSLMVGGTVILTAGIETIRPLLNVLKEMTGGFVILPKPAQFALLFLGVAALAHPGSRKHIIDALQALPRPTGDGFGTVAQVLVAAAEMFAESRTKTENSWKLVEAALQPPKANSGSCVGLRCLPRSGEAALFIRD
jgi:predicted nucleic acid-binding protein